MNNSMKKILVVLMTLFITAFCSGCFKGDIGITIKEDGSAVVNEKFLVVPALKNDLEEIKMKDLREAPDSDVRTISEGNMSGYALKKEYANLGEAFGKYTFFSDSADGKSKGVRCHKGWFYDYYDIDAVVEAGEKAMDEDENFAQIAISQVRMNFVLNLPYPAKTSNADNITNEGKSLQWNMVNALLGKENVHIKAGFQIWHKQNIIATAVAAVVLLFIMLFFLWKALTASSDNVNKKKYVTGAIGSLAALIVLGLGSAYMLFGSDKLDPVNIAAKAKPKAVVENQVKQPESKKAAETDKREVVRKLLEEKGVRVQAVMATSYGHNPNGSLSLIAEGDGKFLVVIDNKNNQVAYTLFTDEKYNFPSSPYGVVIVDFTIPDDKRDRDAKNGVWEGNKHTMTIYNLFDVISNGEIKPGEKYTANEVKASHYHNNVQEQSKKDLADLFLTEMRSLHADAEKRGIKL